MKNLQKMRYVVFAIVALAVASFSVSALADNADDQYWLPSDALSTGAHLVDAMVMSDALYIAGRFEQIAGLPIHHVAKWDGNTWSEIGGGVGTADMALVHVLLVDGNKVYVAGMFGVVGGNIPAMNVAMWDGSQWDVMGGGTDRAVRAIAKHPNGDIYLGGEFTEVGGVTARGVARWDGQQWHALGTGIDNHVGAIAIKGNDVFVGGAFRVAGGKFANYVARWDGSEWHTLGDGVDNLVTALAVRGNDVYVGGLFRNAGGMIVRSIAKWNGYNWWPLGEGVSGLGAAVRSIFVDENDIYIGGLFSVAGTTPANYLAKWDGSEWSALGSGTDWQVKCFARHGDVLYVGGEFGMAGGKSSPYFAHWTKPDAVPVFFHSFSAEPVGYAVALDWELSYDEPITGFRIYRSVGDQSLEISVNGTGVLPVSARHFEDRDIQRGVEYRYVLSAVRGDGSEIRSPATRVSTNLPTIVLSQNEPNPFNPSTRIRFSLSQTSHVFLSVFDGRGRHVKTLVDGPRSAGEQEATWDGTTADGSAASTGVYFYRLEANQTLLTRKMVLLK